MDDSSDDDETEYEMSELIEHYKEYATDVDERAERQLAATLAEKFGAMTIWGEHRYFGTSMP